MSMVHIICVKETTKASMQQSGPRAAKTIKYVQNVLLMHMQLMLLRR
jgi:hypothetical protein